jgi:ATP-dependent RNA helicase SUPV3L1/SUV3
MRARRVASAKTDAFKLARNARILWRDEEVARLEPGDDPMRPIVVVLADDHLASPDKEKVQQRLDTWVSEIIAERLKPLMELKAAEDVTGLARGIAFRLSECYGIVKRDAIADEMRQLDQPSRGQLRKYGVRFGAFNIFLPPLLKPAPAELTLALWVLNKGNQAGLAPDQLPEPPRAGLTSVAIDPSVPEDFYRAAGYHVCGPRAIRVDMLERLADSIRPLLAWRPTEEGQTPPRGSSGDGGFTVTPEMMSILGCSSTELGAVLATLGFQSETRPAPKPRVEAPRTPVVATAPVPANDTSESTVAPTDAPETDPAQEASATSTVPDVPAAEALPVDTAEAAAELEASTGAPVIDADATTGVTTDAPVAAEAVQSSVGTEADVEHAAGVAADAAAPVVSAEAGVDTNEARTAASPDATAEVHAATEPAAVEAEVVMIEVWRPRRRHREDRRPRRQDGRGSSQGSSAAHAGGQGDRDGAPARDREPGQGRGRNRDRDRNRNRSDIRPPVTAGEPPVVATDAVPDRQDSGQRRHDRPRQESPRQDGPRREGQGGSGGYRGGGDNRRPGGGGRDDRRDDQRRRDDRQPRPRVSTAAPQRKGGIDPDSPFAALSALKQQLEKNSKTPGS